MKKAVVILLLLLTLSLITPVFADAPKITNISVTNSPLALNTGKQIELKYHLFRAALLRISVFKNNQEIRILRGISYQSSGYLTINWDGKNSAGQFVTAGDYVIRFFAREPVTRETSLYNIPVKTRYRIIFTDIFARSNGLIADNYGHLDPLGKWKVTSHKFYARDNLGYTDSKIFRVVTYKSDFRNFTLTAKMLKKTLGTNGWDGIQVFFRYVDPNNLYVAGLRNDNGIHLKKKIGGKYYLLGKAKLNSRRLNHWYNIKIITKNRRLSVSVDGQKYIDVIDRSLWRGRVGIRVDNIQAYFDDYKVYEQY